MRDFERRRLGISPSSVMSPTSLLVMLLVLGLAVSCAKRPTPSSPPEPLRVVSTHPNKRAQFEAFSSSAMVSTQNPAATRAAVEVLRSGGNLIDAFVAASLTLSVERPFSTGLGGGGFLVYREATGAVHAFDFRERAPLAAHEKLYLDAKGEVIGKTSQDGPLAVAVPGLVKGLFEVHRRLGSRPWRDLAKPAITLAEDGLLVYPALETAIKYRQDVLSRDPASREIFLKADGSPWVQGERLFQKDLANTLRILALKGADAFYSGEIAKKIVLSMRTTGGLITHEDLKGYTVKTPKPLSGMYQGYHLYTMPPPSSGGVHILQILGLLEPYPLKTWGPQSPSAVHVTASAMQLAFRDRADHLGDPAFYPVPISGLLAPKYLDHLRASISLKRARVAKDILSQHPARYESDETTHFSMMDAKGNMLASTQTINGYFGSGVTVEGTGILLNNEMDDFSIKPGVANMFGALGGEANKIEAGKTPLSSMSPLLVLKDNQPVLSIGAPGGTRIITCVLLATLNMLAYGMDLYTAISATRYHHQWQPDQLTLDAPGLSPAALRALLAKGHTIKEAPIRCSVMGVASTPKGLHGVSEPRGEGLALGL